ncbi:HAD family hydrolase [Actinoplanes couchii]|uniref:Hydrolase n=1 Tax=Actinoplanes couchii TaxID=403638 RepID=A0ABQ3XQX0_9ACTN|nr:HAD family hydrolase [Actinoplanes couchii]MDR6317362.1 hydroxymethylpyrimidine pyrophosphatase-like HAD family hydrolase [Actinoplanes couchii]GID60896.1 hydrolase [Actinoplanes couchii]
MNADQRTTILTDLDGTVVPSGDVITPATLDTAVWLRDQGIPLITVTARTPAGVARLGPFADLLTLGVGYGGALGWNPATGETLWQEVIGAGELRDLAEFAGSVPGIGFSAFGVDVWRMTATHVTLRGGAPREPWLLAEPDEIASVPAHSASLRHPTISSDEMITRLTAAGFATRLDLTYAASGLVNINPLGVDKAVGVRRALDLLGRDPADAIAFGDMPNDLPMFACCGRSVAVGNAHPAILAAATDVTAAVTEDGFAQFFRNNALTVR